jgi:hypothetical protein
MSRVDMKTWFDYLDLDDHVTFGGKGLGRRRFSIAQ